MSDLAIAASSYASRFNLKPGEAERVGEITAAAGVFSEGEIQIAQELAEESLSRGPHESGYLFAVASLGQRTDIIGYTCWGPIPCTTGSFDLYWIVVLPEHAGKGVGKKLMAAAEEQIAAADGRKIYVETSSRPGYAAARAFYLGNGYTAAAEFKDFYADGDDKIVYVKDCPGFNTD
jgi:ribosomal protein S18 acetylase RimI-like enzyme